MNSNIRSLGVIEFHNPNYSYPVTELLRTHEPIRQPENELREDGYQYRAFYISKIFHLLRSFYNPDIRRASSLAIRHHSTTFSGRFPMVWLSFMISSTILSPVISRSFRIS